MNYHGDKLWELMTSVDGRVWIDADAVAAVYTGDTDATSCQVFVRGIDEPFSLDAPMSDFMTWLLAEKARRLEEAGRPA